MFIARSILAIRARAFQVKMNLGFDFVLNVLKVGHDFTFLS